MKKKKAKKVILLIEQALEILDALGVPTDNLTPRRKEKMAMVFLAVADVSSKTMWVSAKSQKNGRSIRTREVISYVNKNFGESISLGSYDDIRRKDLLRPVGMGIIVKSAANPAADTNDGTRGYALSDSCIEIVRSFGTVDWDSKILSYKPDTEYIEALAANRTIRKLPVKIENGVVIELGSGPHNELQKAVINNFLPLFGHKATVLYIGDTSDKKMYRYNDKMAELGLAIEDRGMLPDIIAYSEDKDWIFLIEAVHSSNPLNPERCIELRRSVLKGCNKGIVFVTAFLTRNDFRKWVAEIAWETEVWLAENPEHMIHFNGDMFFGPYKRH